MSRPAVGILAALLLMAAWFAPAAEAAAAQDPTTAPPTVQTVPITVVNTAEPVIIPTTPRPLASTGSNLILQLQIGIALVIAGMFVMTVARIGRIGKVSR